MNIGIDIVAVDKFESIGKEDYERWQRVFSEDEWEYAFKDGISSLHLAGIFATKEAIMKATGRVGVKEFRSFEIKHTKTGAPVVTNLDCIMSVSHDKGLAVSVVLIQ